MKGDRIRYTARQIAFIKRRRKWPRLELHAAFVKKFRRRDVSFKNIKQLCSRNGWATDPIERRQRTRGRTKFSSAERAFLKRQQKLPRRDLYAAYVEKFQRKISLGGFKALLDRLGLRTGRTGRFEKGVVPANKGKKMPFNANSARTQFKKGSLNGRASLLFKSVGSERLSKDGYLERKINNDLPMQARWRAVHLLNWESENGALPAGHCLKCLDGDKRNTAPSNWELISRAVLARLNKSRNRFDTAPAELKPAIMAIAKLRYRLGVKRRSTQQQE